MERRRQLQGRAVAAALSLAAHAALLFALLSPGGRPQLPKESPPVTVELVDLLILNSQPASAALTKAASARVEPQRQLIKPRPAVARDQVETLPSPPENAQSLSEAELAGAATAGTGSGEAIGGSGGAACDMAARVQTALRQDPLVKAAVSGAAGKVSLVWDGDWVRSGREDGKGLAAVREAILWAVGFAPKACRGQAVRGLVLLSVDSDAGPVRLVVGAAQWRWSDLLTPRASAPDG
jgi:hypothetical protein